MTEINCPVCSRSIRRKKLPTGAYHVYVCCDCRKEYLVDKGDKNYSCMEFMTCALSLRIHCKGCSRNGTRQG